MGKTKIEWCDFTSNLWHGCFEVHAGCDNCYARVLSHRWGNNVWTNNGPRLAIKSVWKDLERYQRDAAKANRIDRVFVGSMMDIFEKPMPVVDKSGKKMFANSSNTWELTTDLLRDEFFTYIVPNSPNLMFLLLTKRPSNINKYIPEYWKDSPPDNVMFGTSPVDQPTARTLITQLLQVKGKKFLSVEPQLGEVVFEPNWLIGAPEYQGQIDWVIQGGESGHHKRPFNLDWAYQMRDQCSNYLVPYFFKQIDKVQPIPEDLLIRQFP